MERPVAADTPSVRERNALGYYEARGLLRYRDFDAYYCTVCRYVYGVVCPRCGVAAPTLHLYAASEEPIFVVESPLETENWNGLVWTKTRCRKCDFRFRVIVH